MTQALWRAMTTNDIGRVEEISDEVHGAYTEPGDVYAERLQLHPSGCFVLEGDEGIIGYMTTHPWRRAALPGLGEMLGAIPPDADTYYLHDIALLPAARGSGSGRSAIKLVKAEAAAAGLDEVTLIAVNGADRFWASQGFAYDGEGGYGEGTFRMRLPVDR
jgi:GNAT superfamily N-acetyltransferase